jgi:hypothetical protein
MSAEIDRNVCEVVDRLIPIVKGRVLRAMERSREDVEFEISTLANLLTIRAELCADHNVQ